MPGQRLGTICDSFLSSPSGSRPPAPCFLHVVHQMLLNQHTRHKEFIPNQSLTKGVTYNSIVKTAEV